MRVLHFYSSDDSMIASYVTMLNENMGLECTNEMVTDASVAQQRLQSSHYDIVNLHGCWRISSYLVVRQAVKNNTRIILTPHGQLEPWEQKEDYWTEKLPKRITYLRRLIRQAYAVIIQGKMEQECMSQLKWNPRTVIIKNALVTSTITPKEMAAQTYRVYVKVMDSNPLALMDDDIRQLTRQLIKTGITGDKRWLNEPLQSQPDTLEQWRLLLCYAHQEQITQTIRRGLFLFGYEAPDLDVASIPYFVPADYQEPHSIESVIGMSFVSENDRLMATFRLLQKLAGRRQLAVRHLIELDKELREHNCDEDALCDSLQEHGLYKFVGRLFYVVEQFTGLTEGFMPLPPRCDRTSRVLYKQVENYLKI